ARNTLALTPMDPPPDSVRTFAVDAEVDCTPTVPWPAVITALEPRYASVEPATLAVACPPLPAKPLRVTATATACVWSMSEVEAAVTLILPPVDVAVELT